MYDRAWIREDTLTMQLAMPPDLCIHNRHIYMMKWYKVTGATGWQKMRDRVRTAQHCPLYEVWTYTVEQGTYMYNNKINAWHHRFSWSNLLVTLLRV